MNLDAHIEAILFYRSEPVSFLALARILGVSLEEIRAALPTLTKRLEKSGLRLMEKDEALLLVTAPESAGFITTIAKEETIASLGTAGLETLAIILYDGPLPRATIDYIRGVNSHCIVRALLIRGLVEKTAGEEGQRAPLYRATFDLLAHLGITSLEALPEYGAVRDELHRFEAAEKAPDKDV